MAEAPWRQAAVPTPPPTGPTGHIPSSRLKSEISDRRVEPPLCVQNAMLTKDKKPFTYTPGGIDLSEIKSPRMARRLERNAMNEGVSSVPQTHHHPTGPLPPSALAAMQPHLSVQVFPSGGVPHCGPPAPPPPPLPKAPPMKTSPLPTDCYDRPDMTKIIPDNPMALLRKTAGPVIKQDPILNRNTYAGAAQNPPVQKLESPPVREYNNYATQPKQVEPRRQISAEMPTAGVGSIYVPPINQNTVDTPPPAYYKRQPSTPQPEPVKPQTPDSPKPSLSKAPTPWLTQRRQQSQDVPEWAVNDHRVQSPPLQQQEQQWTPQAGQEPPPQPKPVRPWQQADTQPRQQQQPELQSWQQRQPEAQPWQQQQPEPQPWQQRQPESQPWQQRQPEQFWPEPPLQKPQGVGVKKQVQNREAPQQFNPVEKTEVVIVNDPPLVYHHPGQTQQRTVTRQAPQQQDQGVRIIPVQIEGRASNGQVRSPQQNSDARSLSRQLSWNSTPTQSNTFRVLQKITQTDGDDEDDQVVSEHSPKMYQQFPQRQASMEQQREWNQGDSDQALMNTFKQGCDENATLHNEVDPRYRGPDIPSKAFKLLQNMTGGPDQSATSTVPQGQQSNAHGPKVRTIPIQIEGNGSARNYVPPSEQQVQEPKKYMGGSIPSRSFKILQAMTAPDECGPGQSDL